VGIGWFRLALSVNADVAGSPLALFVHHVGASEVFVNGRLVHRFGVVSQEPQGERPHHITDLVAHPIELLPGRNVIAVRYSDHDPETLLRHGGTFGPQMALTYAADAPLDKFEASRQGGVRLAAVTVLPAAFSLLHLLLFAFYPANRQNLHYAVFAAFLAALDYNVFMHDFLVGRPRLVLYQRLLEVLIAAVSVTGLRFVYSCFYDRLPKQFYPVLAGGLLALIPWTQTQNLVSIFSLICLAEMMRAIVLALLQRRAGARILAVGCLAFFLTCSYQLLGMLEILPLVVENIFVYGELAMTASMSIFLAREFAGVSRDLGEANRQLTDYSHTLEERVGDRTRELSDKNEAMEQVLTELQSAQNQMVLQEKMASLGGLVAGIAHEINTPVGAINSIRDTLSRAHQRLREVLGEKAEVRPASTAFEVISRADDVIAKGTERVAELVQSLRTFAQLDGAEYQNADLHKGLDSAVTLLQTQLEMEANIVKKYGDLPPVYCAGGKLNQVFLSLLKNAAAAEADQITIRTMTDDGQAVVEIVDDGVGIPGDRLERVFDFGFRTSGATVKMGFGLATSYNIVREHGGDLLIDSEVGVGTRVVIRMPLMAVGAKENNAS
jgi:signal transduction histidine kinase